MAAARCALRLCDMRARALLWVVAMVLQHGSGTAEGLRHLVDAPPHEGTVRTIQSPDGDIVDCVLIHQQPAFKHPLLENHIIQEFPSFIPVKDQTIKKTQDEQSNGANFQVWHQNEICPSGTIPILRNDPTQAVHKKYPYHTNSISRRSLVDLSTHEYAVVFYTPPANTFIYGSSAVLSLWDPYVEPAVNEFSLSQLWITAGSHTNKDMNTIEVGWQVSPEVYKDTYAHLFIYWTADDYENTGCYNVANCSGFVQLDNSIAFGGAFQSASSVYEGNQVELPQILVQKDQQTQNWWLQYGSTNVGYWPKELFTNLADHAESLSWGGEVINLSSGGSHTSTQMGSGHFANEGYGGACYTRGLAFFDSTNTLYDVPLENLINSTTNPSCYDIEAESYANWGTSIFFGGPGKNPNCP